MKTKAKVLSALLVSVLTVAVATNADAAKKNKGGLLGNSYGSQMEQVTDTSIRITTRKKVQGTLDEINTPGTTTAKAFQQIQMATIVRAAVEANNLGFKALKAAGTRNLSQTVTKRSSTGLNGQGTTTSSDGTTSNSCPGGVCESDFTFAQGHYNSDVELAIEVTFDMLKDVPTDSQDYIDVAQVMQQYGL